MKQDLPWYKDWRSWLTIVLLLFTPTFIFGVVTMWVWTNWNKKVKWLITLIVPVIIGIGVILSFILMATKPKLPQSLPGVSDQLNDAKRRESVAVVSNVLYEYRIKYGAYPESLDILVIRGLIEEIPKDPKTKLPFIRYRLTNNGADCLLEITLSTDEENRWSCRSGAIFPSPTP